MNEGDEVRPAGEAAQAALVIRTLGGLDLARAGAPLVVGGALKATALVVYLACTRRPHPREVLADLLWDDRGPQQGQANLRQLLTRLDPQLLPALHITRTTLALNPATPCWVDVVAFDTHLAAVQAHLPAGTALAASPGTAAIAALEQAVALYRGPFLAGFPVRDSRGFEDWMIGEQQRLEQAVLQALHALVRYYLDQGAYDVGMPYAQRLIELDALDEAAHRALMRLLAYSGQRARALEQYAACERICRAELGVAPSSETTALYARIQAEAFDLVAEVRPPASRQARPQYLPVPLTPFVARERELAETLAHVSNPATRLVTLVGPAGSGKTRLALQAAQLSPGFPDGVYFAPLAGVTTALELAAALLAALQHAGPGRAAARPVLLAQVRAKALLLVLDDWALGPAGIDLLQEIARQAPRVTLLVTARAPLPGAGGVVIDTTALTMPTLLLAQLAEADDDRRAAIYAALAQLRVGTTAGVHEPTVHAALQTEIQAAYRLAVLGADLGPAAQDPLLGEALAVRAGRGLDRIRVLLNILGANPPALAGVPPALADLLQPLLGGATALVLALAAQRLGLPRRPAAARLAELAQGPDPWLRVCAFFQIGALGYRDLASLAVTALADPDPLVRETALAACRALCEPAAFETLARMQATAEPGSLVAQYAGALLRVPEAV